MISIKNLNKTYGKSSSKYHALKNINLELPDTGFVCILGQSGSGKTTLMNIIGSLDSYDSGSLKFKGKELKNLSEEEVAYYRSTSIGFIFQDYNVIEKLTVEENVNLALNVQGKSSLDKVHDYLELVELKGLEKRKINELSGGQKQRVAIARALIKEPDILLCDEATGNVDSNTSAVISNIIKKISREKLVIFITHDSDLADNYADRIINIKDGEVISDVDNTENASKFSMKFTKNFGSNVSEQEVIEAIDHARQMNVELDISINPSSSAVSTADIEVSKQLFHKETRKAKSAWKYFMSLAVDNIRQRKLRIAIVLFTFTLVLTITSVTRSISTYTGADDYVYLMDKYGALAYDLELYEEYYNEYYGYKTYQYYSSGDYIYEEAINSVGSDNVLKTYKTNFDFNEESLGYVYESIFNYTYLYSVSNEFDFNKYNFVGNEPVNQNQLVVTSAIARHLFGEKSDLEDYIGETYTASGYDAPYSFTVSGVIDTGYEGTTLDSYFDYGNINSGSNDWYQVMESHLALFTHEDFFDYQYFSTRDSYESYYYTDSLMIGGYGYFELSANSAVDYTNGNLVGNSITSYDEILVSLNQFNKYCYDEYGDGYYIYNEADYAYSIEDLQDRLDNGDADATACYNELLDTNVTFELNEWYEMDTDYLIKSGLYVDFDSVYPNGADIVGIADYYNYGYIVHDDVMNDILEDTKYADVMVKFAPSSEPLSDVETLISDGFNLSSSGAYSEFSSIRDATYLVDFFLTPKVTLIITIVLALIPTFFLYLFNNIAIDLRKKEVGILKSIGSSNNQVMSIFFLQSIIIGIVSLIIAVIGAVFITSAISSLLFREAQQYGITGYSFTVDNFIYVFVLSFVICTISLVIPYIRFNKKPPINIVKDL